MTQNFRGIGLTELMQNQLLLVLESSTWGYLWNISNYFVELMTNDSDFMTAFLVERNQCIAIY